MQNNLLTLNIIPMADLETWKKKVTYADYSPRHDRNISLINASQAAENDENIDNIVQIHLSADATVGDATELTRPLIQGFDSEFRVKEYKEGKPYGRKLKYTFRYPALAKWEIDKRTSLASLGIADGDYAVIAQEEDYIRGAPLTMEGVSSFEQFSEIIWGSDHPFDPMLLSALLYTDEDIELASYVREHFDELHKMSGPRVITYVVERPPKESGASAPHFWKSLLGGAKYRVWNLLGWTKSTPYNKADAYEIAYRLGIFPDQLPCLAIFDRAGRADKIVIPVAGDLTRFFRTTYSNLQHALYMGPGPDIYTQPVLDLERFKLFNKLRETLRPVEVNSGSPCSVYNFYGQTVFINHPKGNVTLQDFQNQQSEHLSDKDEKGESIP